jgi:hypothetical protein
VIPLELRFAFLAAGAMTLLVLGWRLRARRRIYAHLLQGGGVAGLYLTVFAATRAIVSGESPVWNGMTRLPGNVTLSRSNSKNTGLPVMPVMLNREPSVIPPAPVPA